MPVLGSPLFFRPCAMPRRKTAISGAGRAAYAAIERAAFSPRDDSATHGDVSSASFSAEVSSATGQGVLRIVTSKTRFAFGGIGPTPLAPYASSEGMISFRTPPTFMPGTPWSHPVMTSPAPSVN